MRDLIRGMFYLFLGALAGYFSAAAAIGSFGATPAGAGGQWLHVDTDPDSAAHPYAVAHYLLPGRFPPPAGQIIEFASESDADGNSIDGDCIYAITGTPPAARWWSIAIPDAAASGNPAITSDTAIRDPGGFLNVTVSRHPLPGNWLKPASNDNFSLIYAVAESESLGETVQAPPFTIRRKEC
jgi:hypothetical protein